MFATGSSKLAYMSNFVTLSLNSSFLTQTTFPSFVKASRTSLRTWSCSAIRSAQMSRAPASATNTSGTSFAAFTNAFASSSGFPSSGCAHSRSASGSRPRSRAMIARVRFFGLYGRYRSSRSAFSATARIFFSSSGVSLPCRPISASTTARRSSSSFR